MRKVILYIAQSLDGFIADKNGNIDFLNNIEVTEEDKSYDSLLKEIDTVIIGKKTYDQVTNTLSPDNYPYSEKQSFVFTTASTNNLPNISFINEDVVQFINKIIRFEGKDIWIVGGSSIISPLINSNLIDEYRITIIPKIIGEGIPLFVNLDKLDLVTKSVEIKNGLINTIYTKK